MRLPRRAARTFRTRARRARRGDDDGAVAATDRGAVREQQVAVGDGGVARHAHRDHVDVGARGALVQRLGVGALGDELEPLGIELPVEERPEHEDVVRVGREREAHACGGGGHGGANVGCSALACQAAMTIEPGGKAAAWIVIGVGACLAAGLTVRAHARPVTRGAVRAGVRGERRALPGAGRSLPAAADRFGARVRRAADADRGAGDQGRARSVGLGSRGARGGAPGARASVRHRRLRGDVRAGLLRVVRRAGRRTPFPRDACTRRRGSVARGGPPGVPGARRPACRPRTSGPPSPPWSIPRRGPPCSIAIPGETPARCAGAPPSACRTAPVPRAGTRSGGVESADPVGSHPDGDSPAGVHDLAGNVRRVDRRRLRPRRLVGQRPRRGAPYLGPRGGSAALSRSTNRRSLRLRSASQRAAELRHRSGHSLRYRFRRSCSTLRAHDRRGPLHRHRAHAR